MKNRILLLVVALAGIFTIHSDARLVAWYPLDEGIGAGDMVEDIMGDNDGVLINPGSVTRGHPAPHAGLGTSYLFETTGGIDLGMDEKIRPVDQFTISFWFQPVTLNAFDRFYESLAGTGNGGTGIRIDLGGAPGNRARVLLRDGNGATNTQHTHSLTLLDDGTWYFFAVRYDSTVGDGSAMQLTVLEYNGDPVTEDEILAATESPGALGTGPISEHAAGAFIASDDEAADGTNDFGGAMDDLAFFDNSDENGVLSNAQLASVVNFGASGRNLIDLFEATPTTVAPGADVLLSWEVQPFESITIDNGVGDVADLTLNFAGSVTVNPTETTTYTLTVEDDLGARDIAKVLVLAGASPIINNFESDTSLLQSGDMGILSWSVVGADSITIDPGNEDVTGETQLEVGPTDTTTYTLSATNQFGTSTAELILQVTAIPVPVHRFNAANEGNTDSIWRDETGTNNWNLTDAVLGDIVNNSGTTLLTHAYSLVGDGLARGGAAGGFPIGDRTIEVWIRPGELDAGHQLVFENGGGQNGSSILITDENIRFLGSAGNVRNVDITIPTSDLNQADFLQIVYVIRDDEDTMELQVRDTLGTVLTESAEGDVTRGGNGAGIFVWASGGLGGSENNLGGRTELAGVTPDGLTNFLGDIALINIYPVALTEEEIQAAFGSIVPNVGSPTPLQITDFAVNLETNEITLTWNSKSGKSYSAESSSNLDGWLELDDSIESEGSETTVTLAFPPNLDELYFRVFEVE